MFVSQGALQFEQSVEKLEEGRKRKRTNRIQEFEALRRFCLLVNPSGQAFHPNFLLRVIPEVSSFPLDFNQRSEFIRTLLEKSYELALEQHRTSSSQGPIPNRINFELNNGRHGRSILTWTNSGGEMRIVLTLYRGHNARPTLRIIGKYEYQVRARAGVAGIPEPTFDRKWYGILPSRISDPQVNPPRESELEKLMKVKVPLGDLLEFMKKYR